MPFVQNTEEDVKAMLAAIGAKSIDELFSPIPADLLIKDGLKAVPHSTSEADIQRDVVGLAARDRDTASRPTFLGAGIERHYIPHVVDHISLDGNFITAYTPYQPEVSQGTLTAIFQFQTMMSQLTGLPVTNASLYDGASAAAEAMMVAFRYVQKNLKKETRDRVLVPRTLNPEARAVVKTYADGSDLKVVEINYDAKTGLMDTAQFDAELAKGGVFAALLPYPNFFGCLNDYAALVDKLKAAKAVSVAIAHPLALALLKSPGEYGFDIAVGEGQTLGCYQALGGPAFGFFSCSNDFIRFAPGRIVSQTVDKDGKRAFCLALATREQHIRREKATSNICTNQALMALRATIYLAAWGKKGLVELSEQIASSARYAAEAFQKVGVKRRFADTPFYNELVVGGPADLDARCDKAGIQNGLNLGRFYPELKNCYLVTVGELLTKADIDKYAGLFK